jgi:CRISPR/Cas system CSM-associated protein Csm3 (group 7 of RAMP superfamily)
MGIRFSSILNKVKHIEAENLKKQERFNEEQQSTNHNNMDKVNNPYNFIEIADKIIYTENHSSHISYREQLLSGELQFEVIPDGPIYVRGEQEGFYRSNGSLAIPSSTVKGCLRTLVEFLAKGRVNFYEQNIQWNHNNNYENIKQTGSEQKTLDIAEEIFGITPGDRVKPSNHNNNNTNLIDAQMGKINIMDFVSTENCDHLLQLKILKPLGAPRPDQTKFYKKEKIPNHEFKGYKFYWQREANDWFVNNNKIEIKTDMFEMVIDEYKEYQQYKTQDGNKYLFKFAFEGSQVAKAQEPLYNLVKKFLFSGKSIYEFKNNGDKFSAPMNTLATVLNVQPNNKEVKFTGTIKFDNLSKVELGILLLAIQLDGKSYHHLGMGKPLGLGRVKFSNPKLTLIDRKERYAAVLDKTDDNYQWHIGKMSAEPLDVYKIASIHYLMGDHNKSETDFWNNPHNADLLEFHHFLPFSLIEKNLSHRNNWAELTKYANQHKPQKPMKSVAEIRAEIKKTIEDKK